MKLNLGCGPHTLEGWMNIDLDYPVSVGTHSFMKHDLSKGLPNFGPASVDFMFSEHFIEHITYKQAESLLQDCYRILKPGGVIRISTPSLEHLIYRYTENWLWEIPGVWEPQSLCHMVNEGMREWGHQFLYDKRTLQLLLKRVGFDRILTSDWQRSTTSVELNNLEVRPYQSEIILEAIKG